MPRNARKGESSYGSFIATKPVRGVGGDLLDMSGHTITCRIFEANQAPRTGTGTGIGQNVAEGARITYKIAATDFPNRGTRYGVVLYAAAAGEILESGLGYVTVVGDDEPR